MLFSLSLSLEETLRELTRQAEACRTSFGSASVMPALPFSLLKTVQARRNRGVNAESTRFFWEPLQSFGIHLVWH